jgi:hypothetical protein
MRQRLPLILSALALLVALFGSTPIGGAARDAIPFALFAQNAGHVNGITASRKPHPGQLLALGSNGKFPSSVIGRGPVGPQGPQGPQGAAGPPATKLWAIVNSDGTLVGGTAVFAERYNTGEYQVGFNQTVSNCGAVASTGTHDQPPGGSSSVPIGMASTYPHGNAVTVITSIPGGFNPFQQYDRGFIVAVFC